LGDAGHGDSSCNPSYVGCINRIAVQASSGLQYDETLNKKKPKVKSAGRLTQVVEYLLCKHKAPEDHENIILVKNLSV
jgi:hypothetical protein